jgi:hypothetical protein
MGEDFFPVRQGHPVEDGVEVFQNLSDGVNRGIWHGVRRASPQKWWDDKYHSILKSQLKNLCLISKNS